MTETDVTTKKILVFLSAAGHSCWRNHTVGIRGRRIPSSSRGVGDILSCLRGGFYLEIEVKTGKDQLSPEQMLRRKNILEIGGLYMVVKSFDDFLEQFNALPKWEDPTPMPEER